MRTILVVDDLPDYFELLTLYSEQYNFISAKSLEEMNSVLKSQPVDLILLDWDLENEKGTDCLPNLKAQHNTSKIPVVMLTGRNLNDDQVFALVTGADDYISKPAEIKVVLAKIEANLRKYHLSNLTQNTYISGVHFDENSLTVEINSKKVSLRKKEFEILKTLSSNPDKVYTREELNYICAGQKIFVSPRTIDTFITHIRNKFENIKLIQTIPRKGYKFNANFNKTK